LYGILKFIAKTLRLANFFVLSIEQIASSLKLNKLKFNAKENAVYKLIMAVTL